MLYKLFVWSIVFRLTEQPVETHFLGTLTFSNVCTMFGLGILLFAFATDSVLAVDRIEAIEYPVDTTVFVGEDVMFKGSQLAHLKKSIPLMLLP